MPVHTNICIDMHDFLKRIIVEKEILKKFYMTTLYSVCYVEKRIRVSIETTSSRGFEIGLDVYW